MKPGWKTSEFALTVVVDAAALVGDLAKVVPDRYAAIMGTLATGLYALSRGWAKSAPPPGSQMQHTTYGDWFLAGIFAVCLWALIHGWG